MGLLGAIGKGLAKTALGVDLGPLHISGTGRHVSAVPCDWCGDSSEQFVKTSDGSQFCSQKCAVEYINSKS